MKRLNSALVQGIMPLIAAKDWFSLWDDVYLKVPKMVAMEMCVEKGSCPS